MGADGSRLGSGFDPGWVEGRLAGPLGRGRAFGPASSGSASDSAGRYCRKEVIVKRVVYFDDDGSVEGSLLAGGAMLNMTGAVGVYRRVLDVMSEYPEYSYYRDGMQGHVVVVDVGGLDRLEGLGGAASVSPTVGVLSDGNAIAVVCGEDGTGETGDVRGTGVLPQVHEIDAWLYGSGLGSVRSGDEVELASLRAEALGQRAEPRGLGRREHAGDVQVPVDLELVALLRVHRHAAGAAEREPRSRHSRARCCLLDVRQKPKGRDV